MWLTCTASVGAIPPVSCSCCSQLALTGEYTQMAAFVGFLLSKRVRVVNEDGEAIGANKAIQLRRSLVDADPLIVNALVAGAGGVAEEDITVTYNHEGSRPPDIVWCVVHLDGVVLAG